MDVRPSRNKINAMLWQPVLAKIATLEEVRRWSIDDLCDANELLDMRDAAQRVAMAKAKAKK